MSSNNGMDRTVSEVQFAVLRELAANGPGTTRELADRVGRSFSHVNQAIRRLRVRDMLDLAGYWRRPRICPASIWAIPPGLDLDAFEVRSDASPKGSTDPAEIRRRKAIVDAVRMEFWGDPDRDWNDKNLLEYHRLLDERLGDRAGCDPTLMRRHQREQSA